MILPVLLLLLGAGPASAIENSFIEEFTTTAHEDAVNTLADWNTMVGKLQLPLFSPTLLASHDTPDRSFGIAISGTLAYVADDYSGLQILDVSNPASPVWLGSYRTSGARDVVVSGTVAYVADMASGLQIIDVSNPASPTLLGSLSTLTQARGVAISGTMVYVADMWSGLRVIDVSNPASPTLLGGYDTPGLAFDVVVSGSVAYVADANSGLQIIDVSNPASPSWLGSCGTWGNAFGVAVAGTVAYVAAENWGLRIIDVSRPSSPALLGGCDTQGYAEGVVVTGTWAYVADYSGLRVIDVSNPASPTLIASRDTPEGAFGIAVSGTVAYVANEYAGVQIIRVGTLKSPSLVGSNDTSGLAHNVTVQGTMAYVGDFASGLQIIDVHNPAAPILLGTCDTPGAALGIAISGPVAYVADMESGLQIIDVSNPERPTILGNYDTPGSAIGVVVSGTVAYVGDLGSGLQILDVSNPASPTLLGNYDTPGNVRYIAISGSVAYLSDWEEGLQILDVHNPRSPTLIGHYDTPGMAIDVEVAGGVAYVTDYDRGLQILDVRNPASPTLLGTYDTPGATRCVTVSGPVVYVADWDRGLQIIDVSNPAIPTLLGSYDTPSGAHDVAISGGVVYVADYDSGLQILEVAQNRFDLEHNAGRSLAIDNGGDSILRARLTSTQVNNVAWELSADGGMNWQSTLPGSGWFSFTTSGSDLLWRATLAPVPPVFSASPPEAAQVRIDWLYEFPVIDAILDVGNDQGRQARIEWTRNVNDFVGASPQVVEYAIFRRIDPVALAQGLEPSAMAMAAAATDPEIAAALAAGWDYVATAPADAKDEYAMVVPTLADSAIAGGQHWSVFRVRARTATPGVFYESYPDSGYSVDNLPPLPPSDFAGYFPSSTAGLVLTWRANDEADFSHYALYRDLEIGFIPSPETLFGMTRAMQLPDPACVPGTGYYYKLCAVDRQGNQSRFAEFASDVAVSNYVTPGATLAEPGRCEIRWRLQAEADEREFRVWRSVERSPFTPYADGQIALERGDWVLIDRAVEPGLDYAYRIALTDGATETLLFETGQLHVPDVALLLYPNHPNPFNPRTTISYSLPQAGRVKLAIYDVRGACVRTLVDADRPGGAQSAEWDGRGDDGAPMPSGVYLVRLETPSGLRAVKMVLTR